MAGFDESEFYDLRFLFNLCPLKPSQIIDWLKVKGFAERVRAKRDEIGRIDDPRTILEIMNEIIEESECGRSKDVFPRPRNAYKKHCRIFEDALKQNPN